MVLVGLTICSKEFSPLEHLTLPTKLENAGRYDYTVRAIRSPSDGQREDRMNANYGYRTQAILETLESGADYVWFTGADLAIINQEVDPHIFLFEDEDIIIACDALGLNNDSWFIKNSPNAKRLLRGILNYRYAAPYDQTAMHMLLGLQWPPIPPQSSLPMQHSVILANSQTPLRVRIDPQRLYNSYAKEILEWAGRPNDPGVYSEGDFVVHVPGGWQRPNLIQDRCDVLRRFIS